MSTSSSDRIQKWLHPNSLTLYRVAAVPALILLLLYPNRVFTILAMVVFSAAAITDYLDGWVARKYGLTSTMGKFLDPLADKLLMASALIMLTGVGWAPAWLVCVVVGREIAVTGLRAIAAEKGIVISASNLGKYKTGFQIAAIIPLLLHYSYFGVNFHAIGTVVLYIALAMTIFSGVDYFVNFFRLIQE
ncbi:MAG: CDP-diacylglycerol--glycerol-3-phosphate 3-phosphatidyltransferase [Desulfatibacillaceae bacterium]